MDFSKLSYNQIISLADELNTSSTQMEDLLSQIKTLFAKVGTDEVWNGTAAAQTKEKFDTLSAKFPEFSQAVNDCHKYLLSVVEGYKSVDTTITGQN